MIPEQLGVVHDGVNVMLDTFSANCCKITNVAAAWHMKKERIKEYQSLAIWTGKFISSCIVATAKSLSSTEYREILNRCSDWQKKQTNLTLDLTWHKTISSKLF